MTPAKKTRPLRPEEIDLTDAMFSFHAPRDFCLDLWRLSVVRQFRTFKEQMNKLNKAEIQKMVDAIKAFEKRYRKGMGPPTQTELEVAHFFLHGGWEEEDTEP